MHASLGPIRGSQTTASLIAELGSDSPLIFATGTAAPCTGIFKPVWVDAPLELGPLPTSHFDPETIFWAHERLHREVIKNFESRIEVFKNERDALEAEFVQGAFQLRNAPQYERLAFSKVCFQTAAEAEDKWLKMIQEQPTRQRFLHAVAWNGFNKKAGIA
jgi:hypothetical protein